LSFPLAPPPVNPNAIKRIKIKAPHVQNKGKVDASPSSPSSDLAKSMSSRMHLRDDFSHFISEINPQGSTQPKANSGNSKGDNNDRTKISSQSGKYGF